MTTKLAELKALMAAVPQGPYFVGDDVAHDTIPHADSGLAMVDTGRESDRPVARLCEWGFAQLIQSSLNALPALIDAVEALRDARPYVMAHSPSGKPFDWPKDLIGRIDAALAPFGESDEQKD